MIFTYKAIDNKGASIQGDIDVPTRDEGVRALQRRGLIVVSLDIKQDSLAKKITSFGGKIPFKAVVIASRQLATLFTAQVSAGKAFELMAETSPHQELRNVMGSIVKDIQGGLSINQSMKKYPDAFSSFYVNMVLAGEESGRLSETFEYLAGYLERQHEITSKIKSALAYPIVIFLVFIIVMTLMMVVVVPNLSSVIMDMGGDIPFYTKIVLNLSAFLVKYGVFLLLFLIVLGFGAVYALKQDGGKEWLDHTKLRLPGFGNLFTKVYLARMSDNINTMLSAGIPVLRTLEITASVVGNRVYQEILNDSTEGVKAGNPISATFEKYEQIPTIMTQMIRVGEETGSLGSMLETLSRFYKREVDDAVEAMIGLIEPVLIILLAVGVGGIMASVMIPIYNLAGQMG